MSRGRVQAVWSTVFLTPGVGLITLFVFIPIVLTAWISLHQWSMYSPLGSMSYVGLANYADVIGDPVFQQALLNTFVYAVASILLIVPLSVFFGIFLYRPAIRGRSLLRTLLFSTYMVPTVAVAIVWGYLYSPIYGPIDQLLSIVHLPSQAWLGSANEAMLSIIILNIWQTLGYYTVLVLAGLTQIPQDYYDASAIDGAGTLGQTRYVTIPLLHRTLVFVIVIAAINTLQVFDPIYVLTQGGPVNATNVLTYDIYQTAFQFGRAGAASAMAILLLIVLLVAVTTFLRVTRED
ncbi:MAG: sugar ABC transporter permease [Chloroflexi bacterium]|nr:sugar ABC transporter permease [Chloroflexota bacterium]